MTLMKSANYTRSSSTHNDLTIASARAVIEQHFFKDKLEKNLSTKNDFTNSLCPNE